MQSPKSLIAALCVIGWSAASAQQAPTVAADRCMQYPSNVRAFTTSGKLFIHSGGGWTEVTPPWFNAAYPLLNYNGAQLWFVYVAPPSSYVGRQFLSIRTVADVDADSNDDFVNLRRQHSQFDVVNIGQYQDYHANGKASGRLYRFHTWPDGSRSDTPQPTREAWSFQRDVQSARRRVLSISYIANGTKITCVPFVLGPNIATPDVDVQGEDEILVQKGFTIEVTEAKNGVGTAGRTIVITSQPSGR